MFTKELFLQGVAGKAPETPDKAGPKRQQRLSNLDAKASEEKVIGNFLYMYSRRRTSMIYQKKDTLANMP